MVSKPGWVFLDSLLSFVFWFFYRPSSWISSYFSKWPSKLMCDIPTPIPLLKSLRLFLESQYLLDSKQSWAPANEPNSTTSCSNLFNKATWFLMASTSHSKEAYRLACRMLPIELGSDNAIVVWGVTKALGFSNLVARNVESGMEYESSLAAVISIERRPLITDSGDPNFSMLYQKVMQMISCWRQHSGFADQARIPWSHGSENCAIPWTTCQGSGEQWCCAVAGKKLHIILLEPSNSMEADPRDVTICDPQISPSTPLVRKVWIIHLANSYKLYLVWVPFLVMETQQSSNVVLLVGNITGSRVFQA